MIIALRENIPNPFSFTNSETLYASTRLLILFCKSLPTPYGNRFCKPSSIEIVAS